MNKAGTTTTVTDSANPSGVEQAVTFTATVAAAAPGSGNPTGTVTFRANGNLLGTGTLSTAGGVTTASFTANANTLPLGMVAITADYAGDTNFLASNGSHSHTVLFGTTTSIASSLNPSKFGQPVTFTATVAPAMPGTTPTGTVTFTVDGVLLGTGTLNASGIATFTTSSTQLVVGANQTVTASYDGDSTYAISSASLAQTVDLTVTTTALSAAPASGVAQRAITFTAHVSSASAGSGTPTGQVVFTDQKTGLVLGTVTLDASGNAVLVHHLGTPLGNHVVRADYQGDTDHSTSTGTASVNIVANGTRTSTVALKSSANPTNVGIPVTFTATVRDTGAAPLTNPGGTVMFVDKATIDPATGKAVVLGYGTLVVVSPGVMRTTLTLDSLAVGSYDILARYSGNGLFAKSISAVLTEVVKPAPTRTSTTGLVQSSSSSGFGATVSFTATVTDTGSSPSITPSGTVTFTDTTTNTVLGTVSVSGAAGSGVGTAVLSTNVLDVGSHDIVATYAGDTDFAAGADSSAGDARGDAVGEHVGGGFERESVEVWPERDVEGDGIVEHGWWSGDGDGGLLRWRGVDWDGDAERERCGGVDHECVVGGYACDHGGVCGGWEFHGERHWDVAVVAGGESERYEGSVVAFDGGRTAAVDVDGDDCGVVAGGGIADGIGDVCGGWGGPGDGGDDERCGDVVLAERPGTGDAHGGGEVSGRWQLQAEQHQLHLYLRRTQYLNRA